MSPSIMTALEGVNQLVEGARQLPNAVDVYEDLVLVQ